MEYTFLIVWGRILWDYIIGPHFFDGRLDGDIYLSFLRGEMPNLSENIPFNNLSSAMVLHRIIAGKLGDS